MNFIAALTVLLHVGFSGGRVTISLMALELQASAATVGLLASLLSVVPMLFAVRWGRYIDRVGVRRPMYTGAGLLLASLAIAAAVPRLETLFIVSVLAGSGFYLFHIAVHQAAGSMGPVEARARNFSVLALAFSTGGVLGPMIAGFCIDEIGHRYTFIALAGALVALLAIMAVRPVEVPRARSTLKPGEKRRIADLLRDPLLRRVFVMSGMLSMAWDLYTFVMPIYGTRLGLSATTIGLLLGVFGAAVFVVRVLLPLVVHHVDEWKMLLGAMFFTAFVLALIPLVSHPALLIALSFLIGIGLGGAQPMIMALLYNKAPAGRGAEAVGIRTLVLNFSQTAIPLMFGALGAALGMTPVFLTMALAVAAGGWYARRK
ncbi:MAG TPA: MFS transporter [Burkholderiales bacterium]|nr:MFS transporter [Burkholderiales bacterium]